MSNGLFSSTNILQENFNTDHLTLMNIKSTSENNSLLFEAMDFSLETDRDLLEANKKFYKTVSESAGNMDVIHESFEGFFSTIKNIIRKVINFLKKIWEKFVNLIMRLVRSDSYLKKHLDDLSAFSSEDEFEYKGFTFTFSSSIPKETPLEDLVNDVTANDFGKGDMDNTTNQQNADKVKQMYEEIREELESGTYYDKVRGKVLGKTSIEETDYSGELFKIYRNDEDTTDTFTVDYSYISTIRNRYRNYDKDLKAVKKVRKDVENIYKKLEDAYEKLSKNAKVSGSTYTITIPNSGGDLAIDKEALNWYDLWGKARAGQIQKISNIHSMAFSAKLDAMKEAFRQDRDVLYKALGKVKTKHKDD